MTALVLAHVLLLAISALLHAVAAALFSRRLRRGTAKAAESAEADRLPAVAVLLPLRGVDPKLADALRELIRQDYPRFELHVVVDRVSDPAWDVVRSVVDELQPENVHVRPLQDRRATCGLACSAFVQALGDAGETVEVIVTVDGDVVPHRTWLRELVEPLQDEGVGATFGNRWFAPDAPSLGGLARHAWNAGAVVPMTLWNIPWGGTMAVRRTLLEDGGLRERWERAMVHDGPVPRVVAAAGLRMRFVPSLFVPVRESCRLPFALEFITRQLKWTFLYHPRWMVAALPALAIVITWIVGPMLAIAAWASGHPDAAAWVIAATAGLWLVQLGLLAVQEREVRRLLRERGENLRWLRAGAFLAIPLAVVVAQLVHALATLLALTVREVTWRGVTYAIRGPFSVELLHDAPYERPDLEDDASL